MSIKDALNELDVLDERYNAEFRHVATEHLRSYVESVTEAVPRFGTNAYICPCCKSGTGNNGKYTPAFFLFRKQDGELAFKCLACNITGDIFSLAGLVNDAPSFDAQRRIVADFLGVDLARRSPLADISVPDRKVNRTKNQREIVGLKKKAHDHIVQCKEHVGETDFFMKRGLSAPIIERFNLGYDPKNKMAVIPFSTNYYVERNTQIETDKKGVHKHCKPVGLKQPLFNISALSSPIVFVTEAPLDALSIIQSGGSALALGGTSTTVFGKVLDNYKPESHFILACDSDEPGKTTQKRLAEMLEQRGISYSIPCHPAFLEFKDANAMLIANPDMLKKAVRHEMDRASTFLSLDSIEKEPAFSQDELTKAKQDAVLKAAAKNALNKWNPSNAKQIQQVGGR